MGTGKKGVSARRQTADKSGEWRFPCDCRKPGLFMSGDYPMMKAHHAKVDSWSYLLWVLQMPPLPLTSRPCPKLSPQAFLFLFFFWATPPPVPTGYHLCFTHHFLTSTATQHFSPLSMCLTSEPEIMCDKHTVWSCLILIRLLLRLTSRMAPLCTRWGEGLVFFPAICQIWVQI